MAQAKKTTKPAKTKLISRKQVTLNVPVVRAPKFLQGFVDFVREQGVVGLAIGLVLGIASKGLVDSLVANIFNPVVGLLMGGVSLENKFICLQSGVVNGVTVCKDRLTYGRFLSDMLSFLIIAAAVYFTFIVLKLDKLDKPKKK